MEENEGPVEEIGGDWDKVAELDDAMEGFMQSMANMKNDEKAALEVDLRACRSMENWVTGKYGPSYTTMEIDIANARVPLKDVIRVWRAQGKPKRGGSVGMFYDDWCALSEPLKNHWRDQYLKKYLGAPFLPGDVLTPHFIHNPQFLMKGSKGFGYHPSTSSKHTLREVMCGYNARLVLVKDYNRPGSCQNAGGQACQRQARRKNKERGYPISYRIHILPEIERAPDFNVDFVDAFLTEAANTSWAQCKEYLDSAVPKPGDNQFWQHTDLRDICFKAIEFNNMENETPDFFPTCRLCNERLCAVAGCNIAASCDGEFWWDKPPNFAVLDIKMKLILIVAMIMFRSKFWKNGNSVTTKAEKVHFGAKKRKLIEKTLEIEQQNLREITFNLSQIAKESLDCEARLEYAQKNVADAMKRIKAAEAEFMQCPWYNFLKPFWGSMVFDIKVKINESIKSENLSLYRDSAAQEGIATSVVFSSTCALLCAVDINSKCMIAQTFRELGKWAEVFHKTVETSSLTTHIASASQLMHLVVPAAWEMLMALFTSAGLNDMSLQPLLRVLVGTPLDQAGIEREMERRFS